MEYIDLHNYLKKIVNYENKEIVIDEKIIVQNYNFESAYRFLLPGGTGNQDSYEYCTAADPDYFLHSFYIIVLMESSITLNLKKGIIILIGMFRLKMLGFVQKLKIFKAKKNVL